MKPTNLMIHKKIACETRAASGLNLFRGLTLMLVMALVIIGCDSIVDQNAEADAGIAANDIAGAYSVVQGSAVECIDPDAGEYNVVSEAKTIEWGNRTTQFEKSVDIEYYNTLEQFVLRVKSSHAIADVLVDDESIKNFDGTAEAGEWLEFTLELDEGDTQSFSVKVDGFGPPAEFQVDYEILGECITDTSPTDVLAVATVPMVNSCPPNFSGRTCETLVGNAITDAFRFTHNVDFGFINSGAIRADLTCSQQSEVCPSDPPLAITRGQVDIVLPFSNSVATLQVNGAELSAMLEHSVSELPLPSGRFFQVSGLCLTVSESATVGNRVTNVVRQATSGSCTGPAVDLTEDVTYEIAINDFVAMGGDGYPDYSDRLTTHSPDVQTVSAWLAQLQSPFEPLFQGRINILP